jgi:acyl-CoA synthetase (AMP-forming)/AMP-acid ligase II
MDKARRQSLEQAFQDFADRVLLVRPGAPDLTYGEFWADADAMAKRLVELGLDVGDRVLVKLENSEGLLKLYLAAALSGVVVCPLDPALPQSRVVAWDRQTRAKRIVDDALMAQLQEAPSPATRLPAFDDDRDYVIIASSGTTGEPKGIVHTVRSMVTSAASFAELSELSERSITYHHFPMFYMAGIFNMFLCPVMGGARIVLGPRFSSLQMMRFWEIPVRHGVNHLTLTPTMAHSLSQLYRTDDKLIDHLSRAEAVISTGSALYSTVARRFQDTFGIPLYSCYGVTEIGGSITLQTWSEALADESVGRFQSEISIRAGADADHAQEILVRTPFMMRGYLRGGEIVSPFDDDGYFNTGDFGYLSHGDLYVTGRENDLVKKGGEFVALPMIEKAVLDCPGIGEAAAVAVPDEYWGSRLILFYTPTAEATMESVDSALKEILASRLRPIEVPDKIIPVPWMPKTSIGKIVRRELVARYTI